MYDTPQTGSFWSYGRRVLCGRKRLASAVGDQARSEGLYGRLISPQGSTGVSTLAHNQSDYACCVFKCIYTGTYTSIAALPTSALPTESSVWCPGYALGDQVYGVRKYNACIHREELLSVFRFFFFFFFFIRSVDLTCSVERSPPAVVGRLGWAGIRRRRIATDFDRFSTYF